MCKFKSLKNEVSPDFIKRGADLWISNCDHPAVNGATTAVRVGSLKGHAFQQVPCIKDGRVTAV